MNKVEKLWIERLKENKDLLEDVDGSYYFWPRSHCATSCMDTYDLRLIADELDRLNKGRANSVKKFIKNQLDYGK